MEDSITISKPDQYRKFWDEENLYFDFIDINGEDCEDGNCADNEYTWFDCLGHCPSFGDFWGAYIDDCGNCVGGFTDNNPTQKDCNDDCCDDPNATPPAAGCMAYLDSCGECVSGNTGALENWNLKCNGTCGSSYIIDECGTCTLPIDACTQDCNLDYLICVENEDKRLKDEIN